MERPEISRHLLEAAASYTIYEDTLRQIKETEAELSSGKYWMAKSMITGKIEMLQNITTERLQEYHNAMDSILSLHCSIPVV